jgi:glutaconate CoA-transferase subunit A
MERMNKLKSFPEVIAKILPGSSLALGGLTLYRRPIRFVFELLRHYLKNQKPDDLTLIVFTGGYETDLLIGAGMVSKIRSCYVGLEIFGLAPMFTYHANHGMIDIIEETEASLAFGLRAQMASVGFMPGRAWLGTDLPRLRPDVKKIRDPYSGEQLMAFPAIKPDVAVIHALKADLEGNAQIGDNKGVDEELTITADYVIVTAETVVNQLKRADIVAPFVDAVLEAPSGAAPTSCYPLYPMDGEWILSYVERVSNPATFSDYINCLLKPIL